MEKKEAEFSQVRIESRATQLQGCEWEKRNGGEGAGGGKGKVGGEAGVGRGRGGGGDMGVTRCSIS